MFIYFSNLAPRIKVCTFETTKLKLLKIVIIEIDFVRKLIDEEKKRDLRRFVEFK